MGVRGRSPQEAPPRRAAEGGEEGRNVICTKPISAEYKAKLSPCNTLSKFGAEVWVPISNCAKQKVLMKAAQSQVVTIFFIGRMF
jgi:hypothetical protein